MTQTLALLLDAYRELNAKKLFWVTLILSALVMLGIAAIGLHETGFSVLWFEFDLWEDGELSGEMLDEARAAFYKEIFNVVGITIWLTWAAIILAIISTAGLFPDMMSSGSIDTLLSKPISRLRLFLTKYCLGLGFVALQVLVFSIAGFLVIGFRAGDWEPRIFLAVPIVVVFFSYLYAICTLVGVYTRSMLAALLVTIGLWFGLFAVNFTDDRFLEYQAEASVNINHYNQALDYAKTLSDEPPANDDENAGGDGGDGGDGGEGGDLDTEPIFAIGGGSGDSEREEFEWMYGGDIEGSIERFQREYDLWGRWRWYSFLAKTPLPKTGETRRLLGRALTPTDELEEVEFDPAKGPYQSTGFMGVSVVDAAKGVEMVKLRRDQRSTWWIILTSLMFEFVVVGLAAWKFCRRDF